MDFPPLFEADWREDSRTNPHQKQFFHGAHAGASEAQ
jgi:hypothetical protein